MRSMLRSDMESHHKGIQHLASLKGEASPRFNFNFVILDTPLFILPSQDIDLEFQIEPGNNIAKFTGEWDTSTEPTPGGFDEVSFVFEWTNPSAEYPVVNVESTLLFNGFGEAHASPPIFIGDEDAGLSVDALLQIDEWWNNPPTSPPYQAAQGQEVAFFSAAAIDFTQGGQTTDAWITGNYDLRYQQFMVPPKGAAVFEVLINIYHRHVR